MKPYTYLIGWREQQKFYYGVRYAKNCDPSELLIKYFTSSRKVKKLITECGLPDIVEIRKVFTDVEKARRWEHKVLRRLKAVKSDKWLNQTDNKAIAPLSGPLNPMFGKVGSLSPRFGSSLSEESKQMIGEKSKLKKGNMPAGFSEKMRDIVTGRKHKDPTKVKISVALTGRARSEEHKKNLSLNHPDFSGENNPFFGKRHTAEIKKLMSEQRTGTIMIHKDDLIKRIDGALLDYYLQQGWIRGKGKKRAVGE